MVASPKKGRDYSGMNALELVMKRRSIRKFLDQPVSEDLLRDLLRAAMAAPSACNAQPWEFVVVTQADMLEQLRGILPFGKMTAPAALSYAESAQSKECRRKGVLGAGLQRGNGKPAGGSHRHGAWLGLDWGASHSRAGKTNFQSSSPAGIRLAIVCGLCWFSRRGKRDSHQIR